MDYKEKPRKFGFDVASGKLHLAGRRVPMPRSRIGRISIGAALIGGGTLGFLPILGFWMVPLGLIVLSHDIAYVRRKRRRLTIWWGRRRASRSKT